MFLVKIVTKIIALLLSGVRFLCSYILLGFISVFAGIFVLIGWILAFLTIVGIIIYIALP